MTLATQPLRLFVRQRQGRGGRGVKTRQADPLLEVEVDRPIADDGKANLAVPLLVEHVRGRYVLADGFDPDVVDPHLAVADQDEAERDGPGLLGHIEDDLGLLPVAGPADAAGIHVVERQDGIRAVERASRARPRRWRPRS